MADTAECGLLRWLTKQGICLQYETRVPSLGREDPLEEGMATHCSILAWKIPRPEEPGEAPVHGITKSRTGVSDFTHTCAHTPGLMHSTFPGTITS